MSDRNLVFPTTIQTDFLSHNSTNYRIDREKAEILPPNTWAYYRLRSPSGYDPMAIKNYTQKYFDILHNPQTPSRYAELPVYDATASGELSIKYLLTVARNDKGEIKGNLTSHRIDKNIWQPVLQTSSTIIFQNPLAKPRIEIIPTPSLTNIIEDNPRKIQVQYQGNEPMNLIIRDTNFPGWQAKINNQIIPITNYNNIYRQIQLPDSSNNITIEYNPFSFIIGKYLSLTACIIITFLVSKRIFFLLKKS